MPTIRTRPAHTRARRCVEDIFSGTETVGLPWQTVSAFFRIITNRRLPGDQLSPEDAATIDEWIAIPVVRMLAPADRHWAFFRRMLIDGKAGGPLTSDAELAALTMENGGVLYTTDRDFAQFPALKWINPLAAK